VTGVAPGPWLRATALVAVAGTLLAVVSGAAHLGTAHRLLAALVAPPLAALLVMAWTAHRALVPAVLSASALFAAAAAVSGAALHATLAALALAALLVVAVQSFRGEHVPWGSQPKETLRDYVTLTKPRIMSLLLITGFCGMIAGAQGWPGTTLVVATMVGLALACGGASALNHVLDRDIDPLMGERTKQRPVASGRVAPSRALEFGLALSAFSFVLLACTVNVLTAALALAGNAFYVVVYTRWLKRTTPQNIVIGGAAGAVPPLVGWAAATGNLTLAAFLLFAIVFVWTPPHFWALALLIKDNYKAAGVPMLPVVRGDRETARQIVLYSVGLVAVTLLPWFAGSAGPVYVVCALALGAVFVWLAERLRRETTKRGAMLLFHYSLLYLALIFVALAVDAAL
jgi:heme o synthase